MTSFQKRYETYMERPHTELVLHLMLKYPKSKLIELILHHHRGGVERSTLEMDYPTASGVYHWMISQNKSDLAALLADGFG